MPLAHRPVILALLLVACGPEAPLGISVDTTAAGLLEDVRGLKVALFPDALDCASIRLGGPRADQAVQDLIVDDIDGAEEVPGDLFGIAPGRYRLAGWGFKDLRSLVAFGCLAAPIQVRRGERATATLVLEPVERR
jgi:hypothetical protein